MRERKGLGEEAVLYARSYALEAERKMGQMLIETERNMGAKGSIVSGNQRVPVKDDTPTLADLGLTKKESARAQLLAEIPPAQPHARSHEPAPRKKVQQAQESSRGHRG